MARPIKTDFDKAWDKAHKCSEDYCRICGRDIFPGESDIIIIETKRKTMCLIHTGCMLKEIARGQDKKTRRLVFTEVQYRNEA